MPRKDRMSQQFPKQSLLPAALWADNVLPRLQKPLIYFHNFFLDLSVASGSDHLQKEMVPILEYFLLRGM